MGTMVIQSRGGNISRFLMRRVLPGKNIARIVLALALGFASFAAATVNMRPSAKNSATTIPESLWQRQLVERRDAVCLAIVLAFDGVIVAAIGLVLELKKSGRRNATNAIVFIFLILGLLFLCLVLPVSLLARAVEVIALPLEPPRVYDLGCTAAPEAVPRPLKRRIIGLGGFNHAHVRIIVCLPAAHWCALVG